MKLIKKRSKEDIGYEDEEFYDSDYYGTANQKDSGSGMTFEGDEPTDAADDTKRVMPAPGVSFAGAASAPVALKVVKPKDYDEGPEIADYLTGGSTVLLNIELLDKNAAKRLIDFLLGATHVLGGTMKMVARGTFVFAPKSVGVSDLAGEDNAEPSAEE